MPKKVDVQSVIDLELNKFEEKLKQFQAYLEQNSIITQVTSNNEIVIAEEAQDKLHKEILIQIKMQDAVLGWLPLLEKLKIKEGKTFEARGSAEVNGLWRDKQD